jgi:hypothetical protein
MLNKERERRAKLAAGPKSLSLRVPPADFKENIFQIAEYTASKKAKLVLITYPSSQEDIKLKEIMQQYRQAEYECQKQIGGYVFDFSSLADSHPIKEIFQNSPQDPVHLTYAGHRLLGETLADFIYQNELAK